MTYQDPARAKASDAFDTLLTFKPERPSPFEMLAQWLRERGERDATRRPH